MRYEVHGYFTVEAALLMPLVVMLYVWLISILFYQYDRALLEQDAVRMLVTGNTDGASSTYMWCEPKPAVTKSNLYKQELTMETEFRGPFFSTLMTRCSKYVLNREKLLRIGRQLEKQTQNKEIE